MCMYIYMSLWVTRYEYMQIYIYIYIIIIMSSSGATGGDQCNRRRLREQPQLKVMPTDARQKSKRNRAMTTRVEETQVNHNGSQYSSPHSNTKNVRQAQAGRGRQSGMWSRHQPGIHRWSVSHRERARRMTHIRLPGWGWGVRCRARVKHN